MIKFDEEKQKKLLEEFRLKEAEDIAQILSKKYGVPYLDLSVISINTDALRLVPESDARKAKIAPFRMKGKNVDIATLSPEKEEAVTAIDALQKQGYNTSLFLVSKKSIERVWGRYKEISFAHESPSGVLDIANPQILGYANDLKTIGSVAQIVDETLSGKRKYNVSQLIEIFIAGALATEASDIHIEPQEKDIRLRMRLDGVLQDVALFEHKIYNLLLSRIKILSSLKLNVKKNAQDGRFSIKLKDVEMEVRTSMIPGAYGESIVMRLLNPKTISVPFERLGIPPRLLKTFEHEIKKPHGMLLNTGPTGSGKTTTLYAFLKKIKTPKIKIITIEDPIEYHLAGITQTQTEEKRGYTFLEGLRSSLRQDPDVIMVGEIRDKETATTAIHAALTGHLVFSTLHTNSAAGAIPRLIDLGINPKIIGSALNVSIAQRLVRRLCESCKTKDTPKKEELSIIEDVVKTLPKEQKADVSHVWRPGKCNKCNKTGYKGRTGIFEAIMMDALIEDIIKENPSERDIKKTATKQGILDMRQDGILKVLSGITSLPELGRVIDLSEKTFY